MSLREDIEIITDEAIKLYNEFVKVDNTRKEMLNRYYSRRYFINLGKDEVFKSGTNKKILVYGFSQNGNIDDRPDIIGVLKLPFGESDKKIFFANQWETERERRGEKNGNLIDSGSIPNINGNC